jgi:hypothetical protein
MTLLCHFSDKIYHYCAIYCGIYYICSIITTAPHTVRRICVTNSPVSKILCPIKSNNRTRVSCVVVVLKYRTRVSCYKVMNYITIIGSKFSLLRYRFNNFPDTGTLRILPSNSFNLYDPFNNIS